MSNNPLRDPDLRHRSIYLLPNAFTTAALFAGFYAVVQAMNGRFEMAAIAIFVAMVLDGMDGRVARLTNTTSAFGEQYDSLSDMTSFGVAPALVMYEWMLHDLGRWGWLAAFVYVCGAALRLARFNTNIAVVDKRFFQGLPSPAAGSTPPQAITTLREPALAEDWAAWTQAWQALDAGPVAALGAELAAGRPAMLTLCGERQSQSWVAQPQAFWQKIMNKIRPQPLSSLIEKL